MDGSGTRASILAPVYDGFARGEAGPVVSVLPKPPPVADIVTYFPTRLPSTPIHL